MTETRWEYCLINCTRLPGPMSGPDDGGYRVVCQVFEPGSAYELELLAGEQSLLEVIGQALNELGKGGWELVAYDTSSNRGVFKRPLAESGGEV